MRSSVGRVARALFAVAPLTLLLPGPIGGQSERQSERHVASARVVVLQESPSGPSRELLDGFRKRLEQLGRRVELIVVDVDAEFVKPASGGTDLVLALGSRATALAATEFRGTPAIGALLTRESALPDGSQAAPVVLEFPLEVELEWMRRILPKAHRVGVLFSTDENARIVARAREIAKGLGLEIIARRVANPSDIPAALSALAGSADVLWGIPDEVVLTPETAKAVLLASLRNRVPFVGLSSPWVRAGAIYALERDYSDLGAQTADLAVRVLDGASSRTLAAVRPRRVLYALNARSAELMHVSLSAELLSSASEVVR
ncbi:MAG: ABC transporter substrate binding protein [bacterium]